MSLRINNLERDVESVEKRFKEELKSSNSRLIETRNSLEKIKLERKKKDLEIFFSTLAIITVFSILTILSFWY